MVDFEIGRGAEAVIYRTTCYERDSVVKARFKKGYRHPDLDKYLRLSRIKAEVRVICDSRKAGVRSPIIYDVDLEKGSITMEYIHGDSVKFVLDACPERAKELCRKIGESVAKLHNNKISHGDLTTSNMILDERGELCLIDFSLGETRIGLEEMGVDIRLLEKDLTSAHSSIVDAFELVVNSYKANMPDAEKVLAKVEEIKGRARYT
ncbi:MAG: Kae1-associated serine/threonine protein kinase [archaeon]|nr:Kae1-associated serine/threonine protein kinase [archaeon]